MSTEKVTPSQENACLTEPKNEMKESQNKEDKFEEVKEKMTNIIFYILIIVTLIGSYKMFNIIEDFRKPLIEAKGDYNVPSYFQLLQVVFWIPIVAVKFFYSR
jgi:hypothetical protein